MKAGFWIRLNAFWIDSLIIIIGMDLFFFLLYHQPFELYLPFELLTIIIAIAYSTILVTTKGFTIGKYLCGLHVIKKDGTRPFFFRALLRESIGKVISFIPLFLGFFWIGFSRSKRGWHDHLSGSSFIRKPSSKKMALIAVLLPLFVTLFLTRDFVYYSFTLFPRAIAYKQYKPSPPAYLKNDLSRLKEMSSIDSSMDTSFVQWLDRNAKSPEEFAVQVAGAHEVTLFGEMHNQEDNLLFFNSIIPDLYFRAGVRCVAMECIPCEMNGRLKKLVTAKTFDKKLALEIARTQGWGLWGDKEYWDVLETVWKLNTHIASESSKMELIGIDTEWDMPSIALLGVGDAPLSSPLWEKLRILRLPFSFLKVTLRDEIMAENIEKEIIRRSRLCIIQSCPKKRSYHIRTKLQPIQNPR